ncbi:MAG: zinc ribbon domain-containing protein [Solobacterium sp.]|nr:zinc ribbon domain-containing protein [Solobacterium sp.]
MYCEKCGYTQEEETNFCPNCGAKLIRPVAMPAEVKEEPETETAAPVKEPEVQPEEKTVSEKKKSRKPLLFILLALLIAAGGYFGYTQLPSTKYSKAVSAARQYMEQKDCASAVSEFEKAFAIRPMDEEISDDAAASWNALAQDLIDQKKYIEAAELAETAAEKVAEKSRNVLWETAWTGYAEAAKALAEEQKFTEAEALLEKAIEKGYTLDDELKDVKKEEKKYLEIENQEKFLKKVAGLLDQEDYELALEAACKHAGEFQAFNLMYLDQIPLITAIDGNKKIGVHRKDAWYTIYYGDYKDDKRDGNGIYLVCDKTGVLRYYAVGEWKDNLPNGKMKEYRKFYTDGKLVKDQTITSTVVNGIYSGEVEMIYEGKTFKGSYTDGIVDVIEEKEDNGSRIKVMMYSEDRSTWVWYTDERYYSTPFGMIGYGAY